MKFVRDDFPQALFHFDVLLSRVVDWLEFYIERKKENENTHSQATEAHGISQSGKMIGKVELYG